MFLGFLAATVSALATLYLIGDLMRALRARAYRRKRARYFARLADPSTVPPHIRRQIEADYLTVQTVAWNSLFKRLRQNRR